MINFHYLAKAHVTESSNSSRNRVSNNYRYTRKAIIIVHKKSKIKGKLHYQIQKNYQESYRNKRLRVQSPCRLPYVLV